MSQLFYFDKALKALQPGQALTGKYGIFTLLIKQLTEDTLSAELESHLTHVDPDKRHSLFRNGASQQGQLPLPTGSVEVSVRLIISVHYMVIILGVAEADALLSPLMFYTDYTL